MGVLDQFIEDEDDQPDTLAKTLQPLAPKKSTDAGVLSQFIEAEEEPELDTATATTARKNIEDNSAIREAAVRFVQDRLGMTNVTDPDEAMEEYIEHFRSLRICCCC